MALVVKDLIDAGVHFGHRASRWNPKMKPYIYGKRNLIHIIDLKETVRGLLRATKFFNRIASSGGLILFVGTKRQAAETIIEECTRSGMPYVTERWLGGTLTNFRTIRSRLERLEELETILDGEQALSYSKKMISTLTPRAAEDRAQPQRHPNMTRLPEALLVVDPRREHIAVAEARKLGLKVVALLDTDCDPDLVDLPIPGNDDSMRSIELLIKRLTDAIIEGKAAAPPEPPRRASRPRAAAIATASDRGRAADPGPRGWRSAGRRTGGIGRPRGHGAALPAPAPAPAEEPVEASGEPGPESPSLCESPTPAERTRSQAEDGRTRAGPEACPARCVKPPAEPGRVRGARIGARASEPCPSRTPRTRMVSLTGHRPRHRFAVATRERTAVARRAGLTPHPDPKPHLASNDNTT